MQGGPGPGSLSWSLLLVALLRITLICRLWGLFQFLFLQLLLLAFAAGELIFVLFFSTSSSGSGTRFWSVSLLVPAHVIPRSTAYESDRDYIETPFPAPGSGSGCRSVGPACVWRLLGIKVIIDKYIFIYIYIYCHLNFVFQLILCFSFFLSFFFGECIVWFFISGCPIFQYVNPFL